MPPGIYTNNLSLEKKLRQAIIPYVILAERLKWRALYLAYTVYAYSHDFLSALAGAGISFPLTRIATGKNIDLPSSIQEMPMPLAITTVLSVFGWIVLKVIVTRNDGEKRATLARNCRKDFRSFLNTLENECQKNNPMPGLTRLAQQIQQTVQRHIAEDSWSYNGLPVDRAFTIEVEKRVHQYCERYGSGWDPEPPESA